MAHTIDLLLLTVCAAMVATIAHPWSDDQHGGLNLIEGQAEDVDSETTTDTTLRLPTSEEHEQAWVNYKQLYSKWNSYQHIHNVMLFFSYILECWRAVVT